MRDVVHTIRREATHAVRALVRAPAFSAIAFVTLALGIGATTAIHAVVEGVLLRPLPYAASDRLVSVLHPTTTPGTGERKWGLSSTSYFHFREHVQSFADIGAYRTSTLSVADPGHDAVEARVAQVTASVFSVLASRAALGRLITDDDDRPGGTLRSAVLSHEFWQRHYGGDSSVVGRSMHTAAFPLEIIGVTQPGLTLPMPGPFSSSADLAGFGVDFWIPLNLDRATRANNHPFFGIARLRDAATVEGAQAEVAAMTAQFSHVYPEVYSPEFMASYNFRAQVMPLLDEVLGPTVGKSLWMLLGAVALVLLIACANVANLFLVRLEVRRREHAIRSALGAGRLQLTVHHLAESLALTLAAGAAGLVLAVAGIPAILAAAPRSVPRLSGIEAGWSTVGLAAILAVLAGVAFGALPLTRRRVDVNTLRDGGRGLTPSKASRMARDGLVVAQVALALTLLVGAGLMVRSFVHLRGVEPGLDARGVLTIPVSLPYRTYDSMEKASAFYRDVADRIAALPGVTAVGGASALPLRDYGTGCAVVFREGRPYAPGEPTPCVATVPAIPGFIDALSITVRGRAPAWTDIAGRTQAVVVTGALAQRLWPNEDAIGKGIALNEDSPAWYRVVGVIPELRAHGLDQAPTEAVFLAATPLVASQTRWGMLNNIELVVKVSGGDPLRIAPAIHSLLRDVDPQIPIESPTTMQAIVDRSIGRTSFIMLLLGLSASIALVLSAVGIYGVISYLVAQRRSEIGVRIALGSPIGDVVRLVIGQSVRLSLLGVIIGLVAAVAGTRLIESLLFTVAPNDPLVLVVVPLLLVGVAIVASVAPARRAARVDPAEAMRSS